MAITSSTYRYQTPFGEFFISAPEVLVLGLRATQKGIVITACDVPSNRASITVTRTENTYAIERSATRFVASYLDYVDCLNELLLQIVYESMQLLPAWELLHCSAAQTSEGENLIAFGNKRAGKSVWAFQQTLNGGRLLADDLLAWDQSHSRFLCFGISSRLRRPIDTSVFDFLPEDAFIPGKQLSYLKHTSLNIASCAERFLPDRVIQIDSSSHTVRRLSAMDALTRIRQSCIPREIYS